MSRRPPNPAAERAAQNTLAIKSLLKLEQNKICADCKRNKHPRWASWNLGVFVCIRCSGIHRGMGTHISRVKSVDLDSWTDEQLQSVMNWGNARANKYWEAKLAPGHMPSEAKIENFIRTKYELKRWVMEGPIPDPATLDAEGDDDVPLSVVKEKKVIEQRESLRKASTGQSGAPRSIAAPPTDLMGGDPIPQRSSTAGPTAAQVPPKAGPAPPKATNTKDSLLGLDFLGAETAPPPRPASATGAPASGSQSRPDLKQSILSLYATAPRPQQQQQSSHASSASMSAGMPSPTGMGQNQSAFGGLNDAFSGLSFANSPPMKPPQNDAFAGLGSFSSSRPTPPPNQSAFSSLSGGSFFDAKPAVATHQPKQSVGSPLGFGGMTSPLASQSLGPKPTPAATSSGLGDLFDFSSAVSPPRAAPAPQAAMAPTSTISSSSVFNLSKPAAPAVTPAAASNPMGSLGSFGSSGLSGADVWGNAWSTPEATKQQSPAVTKTAPPPAPAPVNDFGWGSSGSTSFASPGSTSFASQPIVPGASGGFSVAPKVSADEEFGGWTSSAPTTSTTTTAGGAKPAGGFGASEDLFSNVWE